MKRKATELLFWKKRQLEEEATELEQALSDFYNPERAFKSGYYPSQSQIARDNLFNSCLTLADLHQAAMLEPVLVDERIFETVLLNKDHGLYPALKKHLLYEYNFELIEEDEQTDHQILDYFALFSLLLSQSIKKKLASLYKQIRYIDKKLKKIFIDKRANLRTLVKWLFKKLDDEHTAVNNTNERNQLNYLPLMVHHHGNQTHQQDQGNLYIPGVRF